MKRYLHRIRESESHVRRRWLIGLSSGSVLIIIAIWIFYMRAFVFTASDTIMQEDVRIGFWPVFKNGLTITGSSIEHALDAMTSGIPTFGRKTTTIENSE